MVDEVMKFITEADPEVGEAIEAEAARQRRNLEPVSYTHLALRKRAFCRRFRQCAATSVLSAIILRQRMTL